MKFSRNRPIQATVLAATFGAVIMTVAPAHADSTAHRVSHAGLFTGPDVIALGKVLTSRASGIETALRKDPPISSFEAVEPGILGILGASLAVFSMLVCFTRK